MTGKDLQHIICIIHINELPLKHLSAEKGITTSGPKSCGGVIGDAISDDETLLSAPVVDFKPMKGPLQDLSANDLKEMKFSSDQLYFYQMLQAIQRGQIAFIENALLQWRSPGCLNQARWLTRANRILRYYVSQPSPSDDLIRLVEYIVFCYGPTWFFAKRHNDFTEYAQALY